MNDRTRITAAFAELEKVGYTAKEHFQCCMSCATSALGQEFDEEGVAEQDRKWVFYHDQDASAAFGDEYDEEDISEHGLYLGWGGDGATICAALEEQGLAVEWDGSEDTRILVMHDEESEDDDE